MTVVKQKKKVPGKLGTVLTQTEFETVHKMICSHDQGDHRMAQAILNQCDIQKSIYWIWKISKGRAANMVYLRTVASREFEKETQLFKITWMKATQFGFYLHEKGWLTQEIYQFLKPEILEELGSRSSYQNFYQINIVIKDDYREFDPQSVLTPLEISND